MYLKKDKRKNGRIYLSIAQSYRNEKGIQRNRVVKSLGYLDDLEKEWGSNALAKCEAIRDEMSKEASLLTSPQTLTIRPQEKLDSKTQYCKNLGIAVPLAYYNTLGIERTIRNACQKRKLEFDCNAVMRLLVSDRLFDQRSKLSAWENKDKWFFRTDFSQSDVYRALDVLADIKDKIISAMNRSIENAQIRDLSAVYYDVTNYYFEIDAEDELRKKGVSKEHRKSPIVQMGLLQDKNGIPITYKVFSGNTNDCQTLIPVLSNLKRDHNLDRVVAVADKGINCSQNIAASVAKGDGFVFSQSIKGTKSDSELRDWVLDEKDYVSSKNFKIKSKQGFKTVHLKKEDTDNGKACDVEVEVKYVAFWSEKYARRARKNREELLEKARELVKNPGSYTRATSYGAAAYVENLHFDKKTGEIIDTNKLMLNEEAIQKDEATEGYYLIVTSELNWSDEKILNTYRELWKIEETFKITKSELKTRPIFLRDIKHIEAHFLICYIALCIARLMQLALKHKYPAQVILEELSQVSCTLADANWWLSSYRSEITDKLFALIKKDTPLKWMRTTQIKDMLNKANKPIMEI